MVRRRKLGQAGAARRIRTRISEIPSCGNWIPSAAVATAAGREALTRPPGSNTWSPEFCHAFNSRFGITPVTRGLPGWVDAEDLACMDDLKHGGIITGVQYASVANRVDCGRSRRGSHRCVYGLRGKADKAEARYTHLVASLGEGANWRGSYMGAYSRRGVLRRTQNDFREHTTGIPFHYPTVNWELEFPSVYLDQAAEEAVSDHPISNGRFHFFRSCTKLGSAGSFCLAFQTDPRPAKGECHAAAR